MAKKVDRWICKRTAGVEPPIMVAGDVDRDPGWAAVGPWEPFGVGGEGSLSWVMWRRPMTRVSVKVSRLESASDDTCEAWAVRAGRMGKVPAMDMQKAVVACISHITERRIDPTRCATAAREVLKLWRAEECPPLAIFVEDVRVVSLAARKSKNPIFSRDIRAEGWDGGADRSRSVSTLTTHKRWTDRRLAAAEWFSRRDGPAPGPDVRPAVPGRGDAVSETERDAAAHRWRRND